MNLCKGILLTGGAALARSNGLLDAGGLLGSGLEETSLLSNDLHLVWVA